MAKTRGFEQKPGKGNPGNRNALIEQRRALGLCFQCGEWVKLNMQLGNAEEEGAFVARGGRN